MNFYRGEGRLKNLPHWSCRYFDELIAWFKEHGFAARASGRFSGSLPEQILQQGYVNQPTVSLTNSFDVAAYYATKGNECKEAVVFEIDGRKLREYGEIYDSYATMIRHCEWIPAREFETLRPIVTRLGVLKAGRFLNNCYEQTQFWVQRYGHYPDFAAPKLNWDAIIENLDRQDLLAAGIDDASLGGLLDLFKEFWMFALGQIGSVDTIQRGSDGRQESVETRPAGYFPYFVAFKLVEGKLKAALEGQTADYRQPGWDLTAFGYIAKTCRDQEFFSSGPIPGDCISNATVVKQRPK